MLGLAAVLCAAAAAFLLAGPTPARSRLARTMPTSTPRAVRPPAGPSGPGARVPLGDASAPAAGQQAFASSPRGRALAAIAAAAGGSIVIGGGFGVMVGLAAGVGTYTGLARLEPAARRRDRERAQAMLPLAADLLTAALSVGCPPADAVEQVGRALGGPLGRTFVAASSAARLGSDPARAWSTLTDDPTLRPLGRALVSATLHGTSPAAALKRAALDAREDARWAAESKARSLGARAAAPLGLCFLPAFVLLGIVPIVATSSLLVP